MIQFIQRLRSGSVASLLPCIRTIDLLLQGENLGKGGIDITPSEERSAPSPPPHLKSDTEASGSPESLTKTTTKHDEQPPAAPSTKLLPRETGHDIGMGSPVPLSTEAVGVIRRLRNMKVVLSGLFIFVAVLIGSAG
jgi:hypothetical protein